MPNVNLIQLVDDVKEHSFVELGVRVLVFLAATK